MLLSFSTMFVSGNEVSVTYTKSWINVGESIQFSILRKNDPHVSLVVNSNAITFSDSHTIVGVSAGIGEIRYDDKNGNSDEQTVYIRVYDTRGIVNNEEYYIMNAEYDKLLSLPNKISTNSKDVVLSSRTDDASKQWKLTQRSTGLYTIESVLFSELENDKGLHVTSNERDVYLRKTGSSKTQFEIRRINEKPYEGLYLICYGSKYLAATSSDSVALKSTLDSTCYWSLSRADKGNADMFSFKYQNDTQTYDSTGQNAAFADTFNNIGYTANYHKNASLNDGKDALISSDIFVFNSHYGGGGKVNGSLCFYDETGALTGRITTTDHVANKNYYSIQGLDPESSNVLASLRCVLYLSCNTGKNCNMGSLVELTYEQGAHFVLGIAEPADPIVCDIFLDEFLDSVNKGYSISESVSNALLAVSNNTKSQLNVICMGDGNQYLN
ncbi:MAG: hypothetical protein E7633_06435 [Ruminococcaceae bacterium]|nr:hypothetical protein [Oscillospiraceae bacterium]